MRVSVVIPNWNGVYLMKKHLSKVITASPGCQIVVADDMSTDGSVEYLRKEFPNILVVRRSKREGFAANVNAGVSKASGDIIVLLNTDVEPEKGYLKPLVEKFDDPKVFAVGCLEVSREQGKDVLRGRGIAHWDKGFYIHSRGEVNGKETAWVSGGSGAFRKSLWDILGGMDTLYNPFYWEDIDLSYRARKAGWNTLFEPKSIVHHYHEEGKIKREFSPEDVKRIAYRNQFIFIWKNLTDLDMCVYHILITPLRLLQALVKRDFSMIQGYILAVGKLSCVLSNRVHHQKFVFSDRDLAIWQ